jgi:hypothetical protein
MKKVLVIAVAVGGGLWWNLVGGRAITEANVHDYYRSQIEATLQRQPEVCAICCRRIFSLTWKSLAHRERCR